MTHSPATTPTSKRVSKMVSNQVLNVNHLLNFTLPPRQTYTVHSLPRRSRRGGALHGIWNKERFVNAQYRFVMNPTGDYTVHFADPDIFFQWQDILQVIITRSPALAYLGLDTEFTTCPICLSPPTAPRMTKCGHVFCFPCILHYLSMSDAKWARCPICFDSVNEKQLKKVKWFDPRTQEDGGTGELHAESSSAPFSEEIAVFSAPPEGSALHMRLMQRPQITTLALPRSPTWPSDLILPHQAPFHFLPDVYNYAKFMLATPAYLISDLTTDLDELAAERRTLAEMDDDLGVSFVDSAIEKLRHQIIAAAALGVPALREAMDKARQDQREIEERMDRLRCHGNDEGIPRPVETRPDAFLTTKAGWSGDPEPQTIPAKTRHSSSPTRSGPRQRRNLNPPPPSTSTYYFYQAASGLPIFLHPLDIRILFSHFNGYPSFPDTITIRVEAFSEGTVNDDLRKRCKYLGHMPEGADVVFVEADLEGVVGLEGLKNFEGALKLRRSRREEKARKEDRARARAEVREKEKERAAGAGQDTSYSVPLSSPVDIPEPSEPSEEVHSPSPPPPQDVPGAWGTRSFASALHSAPSQRRALSGQHATRLDPEDEWDINVAWHELEQRNSGGRKKRSNKLVVLGGAGGRRRQ